MDFIVTILGSGSAVPTSRRSPTSQFIQCCNRNILIDCGEGTQMRMRENKVKFQKLDIILISHLHGDHYFGLVGLLSTMHLLGRTSPLKIFAPKDLKNIIFTQLEAGHSALGYTIEIEELEPNSTGVIFEDAKLMISNFPLKHKIPTHGYRIDQKKKDHRLDVEKCKRDGVLVENYHKLKKGQDVDNNGVLLRFEDYTIPSSDPLSYAYCSDTAFSEGIVEHVKGVDLLYHEATFEEVMRDRAIATKHSTGTDAAKIAKSASVKKLILGHLSARYETGEGIEQEAKEIFINTTYVNDGDVFTVE